MNVNKHFKNYILFGDVESHCLLCNETFQSLSQVEKHIRWENHRKSVKIQTCVPKFKQDFIYKLNKIYYCAICNYCTQDIKTLTNHVNDETHKTNKANPENVNKTSIGKYEDGFIVLENNKKISNSQWNGIIGKKCIICSIDVSDIAKHVRSQDHVINLAQTKTKCQNGEYYRKIDEKFFQCFACKNSFPKDTFNDHWTSTIHFENTNKSQIKPNDDIKYGSQLEKLILEARDILIETQKDFFELNYADKKVTCKTCHKTIDLDLKDMLIHMRKYHASLIINENTSENAIQPAREISKVYLNIDHGKRRAQLAMFGRENFIKLNGGARKAYCSLCDVCLSPEIKVFQDHIEGASHSGHLKLKNAKDIPYEKEKYKILTLNKFIKNLNYCKPLAAFMINKEYIVNNLSFLYIKKIDYEPQKIMSKCHVCNIVFKPIQTLNHCETKQHMENFMSSKVVDIREEFIREIQPKIYHCGSCNLVFPFMETLEKHLNSWKHTNNRNEQDALRCVELYRKINGCMPNVEQITLSSNVEIMYGQFMKFAFSSTSLHK